MLRRWYFLHLRYEPIRKCASVLLTVSRQLCEFSYHGKIQDKDDDYYKQFQIVICGLDSVEARRWMNATIVNLSQELGEAIPIID